MCRRQWRAAARALCGVLLLALVVRPVHAQSRVNWDPDERVLVTDFSSIIGLAMDAWRVYAATPAGLLRYDPGGRRWELPLTLEDGYPEMEGVSAFARLSDGTLVLGTRMGTIWRVDPQAERFESLANVPGPVEQLVAAPFGAVHVRTRSGWYGLEAGSLFAQPLNGTPESARLPADPRLQAMRGSLGLDAELRRWPLTALIAGTRPDEYWAGTDGGGLLRIDARTLTAEPLAYGVNTRTVTAIAQVNGMVWFGGSGAARGRSTVSVADTALQRWSMPARRGDELPRGAIAAIAPVPDAIWFASSDGLYRYQSSTADWRRFGAADGLPGAHVTALASFDSSLWVGTRNGACLWRDQHCGPGLLPGLRITALSYCEHALWIGTEAGLWRSTADAASRIDAGDLSGARIQALACSERGLYAITPQSLYSFAAGAWKGPVVLAGRGTLRALAAAADKVWIAGDGGVARWDEAGQDWAYYIAPGDVPQGAIWGILPTASHTWLATPGGAIRLETGNR